MNIISYSGFSSPVQRRRKKKLRQTLMHLGLYIAGLLIVIVLGISVVKGYGLSTVVIDQSMNPTLQLEDTVLIDRASYHFSSPKRMDVIAMRIGESQNSPIYIRRIIGIPGDTVKISDGKIYVDDKEVVTDYNDEAVEDAGAAAEGITLDDGTYFVMCDNYNNSEDDSRLDSIGTVSSDQIIGKIWLIRSPASRFGRVK